MYYKLLKYDIRMGIVKRAYLLIAPALVVLSAFISYHIRISGILKKQYTAGIGRSLGDAMIFVFGGSPGYDPSSGSQFVFPALWMLMHLLLAYITLYYPHRDLEMSGKNILIRTGGRSIWWLSKCAWNALTVISFYLVSWGVILAGAIISKLPITMELSPGICNILGVNNALSLHPKDLSAELLFLQPAVMAACCMMQMTVSLFIKPVFSYILTTVLLLAGTYYDNRFMLCGYAMPVRSSRMIEGGLAAEQGIIISISVWLLSAIIGMARFEKYDVLNREN